jgi:hypothetical protein
MRVPEVRSENNCGRKLSVGESRPVEFGSTVRTDDDCPAIVAGKDGHLLAATFGTALWDMCGFTRRTDEFDASLDGRRL